MQIPKKYFEDKLALGLSSASLLIVVLTIILLVVRLNLASGSSFIVSYRANLGIEAFKSGGILGILNFIFFSVVVFGFQTALCWRTYLIKRRLAIGVLVVGLFLLLLCLVVSNALLALH